MKFLNRINKTLYPVILKLQPVNLRLYWTSMKLLSLINQHFTKQECDTKSSVYIHMAVYNGAEFIAQAIQSIIDQKHQNWKLEIINDGSNDSTYEIISTFLDPRIVCINMSKNEGLWNARNLGRTRALDDANWDYFTTIDADDFASPNWLSRNISLMSKSHAYAIRPINKRINVEGDFQYSYPACDQTFWSKRALNQLGLMETRQGANDSRYMKRAETMACLNSECILLSLSDNHSMRIHDNNHSMRIHDNNTSAD